MAACGEEIERALRIVDLLEAEDTAALTFGTPLKTPSRVRPFGVKVTCGSTLTTFTEPEATSSSIG